MWIGTCGCFGLVGAGACGMLPLVVDGAGMEGDGVGKASGGGGVMAGGVGVVGGGVLYESSCCSSMRRC